MNIVIENVSIFNNLVIDGNYIVIIILIKLLLGR